jgi:site-specific DNA-methyltransferase (adenine-specific)
VGEQGQGRTPHLQPRPPKWPDPTSQLSSVWRIPPVPVREKTHGRHPTQKPLRLLRRAILASTREGALLFDPFGGSGTTGVAAKELDRHFVGAEMEREYADLAGRRIDAAERGIVLEKVQVIGGGRQGSRRRSG